MIHTFVHFSVGDAQFCIDRAFLRGTVEAPSLVHAPGAPAWLIGAWNHQGRAVAVVDPAVFAGLSREVREPERVLLVDTSAGLLGLSSTSPAAEAPAEPFRRRGQLLEVVHPDRDRLFMDLDRLVELIDSAMAL